MSKQRSLRHTANQQSGTTSIENLITAYTDISTSTIGHFITEGYLPDIKPIHPSYKVKVGKIVTVLLQSPNTQVIRQALIQAHAGDILCIDAQILGERACWGALRSCAAVYEQLAGVIILGKVTDTSELRRLQFPVYAQGVSSLTTFKSEDKKGILNATLSYEYGCHKIPIQSGDIAIMDDDGVFVLPLDVAQAHITECQTKQKEDDKKLAMFMKTYHVESKTD